MALDGAYNLKCFKFTVANQLVDLLSTAKAYSQGSTNDVTWDGYTYSFNNSYINLGDSLQGIGNYATISLWFRSNLSGASDYAVFVGWGDGNSNYSSVGIGNWYGSAADESIHIGLNSATLIADYRGGHSLYHDQQWHHAVFTMGPNNYRIYVDGEPKPITYNNGSSSTSTGDIFSFGNSNVETWIGGRPYGGGSGYFNGRIGNIAIYDRILSEIEVSKLFEAHRGRFGV